MCWNPGRAYWELRARLDDRQPERNPGFLNRFAGTYQEDRLRNDWLLLLGNGRNGAPSWPSTPISA